MKTLLCAVALLIAAPAFAQTAPAPAPKPDCCEKMKAERKECCCKDMDHSKMDHSKHNMKAGAQADTANSSGEHAH